MQHTNRFTAGQSDPAETIVYHPATALRWESIVALEPRVAGIMRDARRARRGADWSDYEMFKGRLDSYVGWGARRIELRSTAAYDLCIGRLVRELRI